MKLTCDICGGNLQMMPDNQSAVCTNCGVGYPIESLRQKMGMVTPPPRQEYARQPQPDCGANYQNYQNNQNVAAEQAFRTLTIKRPFDIHLCKIAAKIDDSETYILEGQGKTTAIPVSVGTHTITFGIANGTGFTELGPMQFTVSNYDFYGEIKLKRGAFKASYEFNLAELK